MKKVESDLLFLNGPFTKIAKVMSKNFNIRIEPSGFQCCTDGEVIRIPFNADYLPVGKRELLNGLLDHEVCHVSEEREHTLFGKTRPLELMKGEKNTTIQLLFNAFEDVRIERKYSLKWRGVAENIRAINEDAVLQLRADPKRMENFWHVVACYIILNTRALPTDWLPEKIMAKCALIQPEIDASEDCHWGEDCLALARIVYEKLRKDAEDEEREKRDDEDGEEEIVINTDAILPDADVLDLLDLTKTTMETSACRLAGSDEMYVPNPEIQKMDQWRKPAKEAKADEFYVKAKDQVAAQIGAMRAKQLAYYQTISRRKVTGGLEQGTLEDHSLASVRFGNRNVFSETRRGRMLDTAIEVLIDLSGSMGHSDHPTHPAYYAARTAIALAESWSSLRMPYEMIGFHNPGEVMCCPPPVGMIARPIFEFKIFKGWDESLGACRGRFSQIRGETQNADGEAVMAAACRLAPRKEARRILVVLSDGAPMCPGISSSQNDKYLKKVVGQISRAGIEVIGIGANTDAVTSFYNKSTGATNLVVKDLNLLATTVFTHLQSKLDLGAA